MINAVIDDIALPRENICIITIKPNLPFSYKAGQYLMMSVAADLPARAYSIANRPCSSGTIELHIKNTGGETSSFVFNDLSEGDIVQIEGPWGENIYKPDIEKHDNHPVLFIAGGLGVTPFKAMIEEALHHDHPGQIHLFWGCNEAEDQYLKPYFEHLAQASAQLKLRIIHGDHIINQVLSDYQDFSGFEIYVAGSSDMVKETIPRLLEKNASPETIFYDRPV